MYSQSGPNNQFGSINDQAEDRALAEYPARVLLEFVQKRKGFSEQQMATLLNISLKKYRHLKTSNTCLPPAMIDQIKECLLYSK